CYAGGCENNTLTTVTPNHIEFIDNNHNIIRLMRSSPSIFPTPFSMPAKTVQKTIKGPNNTTATVTAPAGSKIESITVIPLTYMHLKGTWNLVDNNSSILGQITFGTKELKCNWCQGSERQYGFTGIFCGEPVKGDYDYIGTHAGDPLASLDLTYTYHHHKVNVDGDLNITNPNHMELRNIISYGNYVPVGGFNYKTTTGLHLHYDDIIHLTRDVLVKKLDK
ncbi:MAG TPA: hypothetical protein VEL11_10825, partial [Candidatus Bathyarchaeia archaeon]|nr:hypothetical protein [Candidatus Bathyarchaeia archaeon]